MPLVRQTHAQIAFAHANRGAAHPLDGSGERTPHPQRQRDRQGRAQQAGEQHQVGQLATSPRDLATFWAALFEGRVFKRPDTLREMLWRGPHEGADGYRLGIFVKRVGDREFYWHSGFWGTHVYYAPDARLAVAGMTTNQQGYRKLAALIEEVLTTAR